MSNTKITKVHAREVLDSRSNPTVEAEVTLAGGAIAFGAKSTADAGGFGGYEPLVEQIATEEVKIEEQQRVFGIIPNFYVVYDHNAEPLTTKLKFRLALKTSTDPITILGVGVYAAINQAGDVPNYGQGWEAYGKRVGAAAAGAAGLGKSSVGSSTFLSGKPS